jgi:hypothetical protein
MLGPTTSTDFGLIADGDSESLSFGFTRRTGFFALLVALCGPISADPRCE